MSVIKSIYGKLLDWSGLANVPAALKALAGLKGTTGQILSISETDAEGGATAFQAVDKPTEGSNDSGDNPSQGGMPASVKTILNNIMTILKAQVEDGTGTPQAYNMDVSGLFADNDLLIEALGADATVIGITASYDGGDVPVGTALTALTSITVTASYSDGTSRAVTGYTLSGVIAEGNNTITISYSGYSTNITVTGVVVDQPDSGVAQNGGLLAIASGVTVEQSGETLIIT